MPVPAASAQPVGSTKVPEDKSWSSWTCLPAHRAGRVHQEIGIGALNRSGDRQVGLYGRLLVRLEEERLIDPVVASVAVAGEPPTGARTFIGGIGNARLRQCR